MNHQEFRQFYYRPFRWFYLAAVFRNSVLYLDRMHHPDAAAMRTVRVRPLLWGNSDLAMNFGWVCAIGQSIGDNRDNVDLVHDSRVHCTHCPDRQQNETLAHWIHCRHRLADSWVSPRPSPVGMCTIRVGETIDRIDAFDARIIPLLLELSLSKK